MQENQARAGDLTGAAGKLARGELKHPPVKPLDVSGIPTVTVLTAAWALAGIILFLVRGSLRDGGDAWWLWVPPTGFVLGLIGLWYCHRRWRAMHRELTRQTQSESKSSADTVSK